MDACHVLLGKPWQFNWSVKHDRRKNTYSFKFKENIITLAPLSPNQIHQTPKGTKIKRDNLFLSGGRIERTILKHKLVYALLVV